MTNTIIAPLILYLVHFLVVTLFPRMGWYEYEVEYELIDIKLRL